MLKIVNAQGLVLEMPADQAITVEKYNPLFNDADTFFQDISYPFTCAFSENNKLFFGMGQLPEKSVDVYTIPVNVFQEGIQIVGGNIAFRIGPTGYEANLEANLTAVLYLLKNVNLPQIRSRDQDYSMNEEQLAARMLDTVQNPGKYPYIFVPVANGSISVPGSDNYGYINAFSRDRQVFLNTAPTPLTSTYFYPANVPFFKLTYVLQVIGEYLGFQYAGSLPNNDYYNNILIYSRQCFSKPQSETDAASDNNILESMRYMPFMLISDFLKQVRERLHISIDFDLATQVMTVESFATIKASGDTMDITPWVLTGTEQELPTTDTGYSVTLKVDNTDLAQEIDDTLGNSSFPPFSTLVAGDGSTGVELDCGTLKIVDSSTPTVPGSKVPTVNQLFNYDWYPADYRAQQFPLNDNGDPYSGNGWQLRLFRFLGMQETGDGYWPNAESIDLDAYDMDWYNFQFDSKRHIVKAALPAAVLAQIKVTRRFCYRSAGLNYIDFIIEYIDYDIKSNAELIDIKFYVRAVNFKQITPVAITPYASNGNFLNTFSALLFKAYFDPKVQNFTSLNLTIVDTITNVETVLSPITVPTNNKGTQGSASAWQPANLVTAGEDRHATQLRITQGQPKFIEMFGVRTPFSWSGSYWYVQFDSETVPTNRVGDYFWISY